MLQKFNFKYRGVLCFSQVSDHNDISIAFFLHMLELTIDSIPAFSFLEPNANAFLWHLSYFMVPGPLRMCKNAICATAIGTITAWNCNLPHPFVIRMDEVAVRPHTRKAKPAKDRHFLSIT